MAMDSSGHIRAIRVQFQFHIEFPLRLVLSNVRRGSVQKATLGMGAGKYLNDF